MDRQEIFAKNLEKIRKMREQSLAEFAEDIGLPKSTLQSVRLTGHTTLDTATRIADGLGLPLDSLTGDDRLAEKVDIIQYLLRTVEWARDLSADERDEVARHFRKILEVLQK